MIVSIFLVGSAIGWLLNVCIYRISRRICIADQSSYYTEHKKPSAGYDLIPIIDYRREEGKYSHYNKSISLQHIMVGMLNGILYLALYYRFGLGVHFVFYGIIFSILIIVTYIDIYHQIIPNLLTILLFILTIMYKIFQFVQAQPEFNLWSSLLGLVFPACIFLLIAMVSKGNMGGGDVKLISILGFILGIKKSLIVIFLSFTLGAIISIFLLLFKIRGKKDFIPFGPFICIAFIITLFSGERILNWYMHLISY